MKNFINKIKDKYNYSNELCAYLVYLIPSLIIHYGVEHKEAILEALYNCEIHVQEKDEDMEEYLDNYFEENMNFSEEYCSDSPAFYINNIVIKGDDIFLKPIVFIRTMFFGKYVPFDFTNEDQVHYLTHEICHLVKGYNRLEISESADNSFKEVLVSSGFRTDYFNIYDENNFCLKKSVNTGFEEALNCYDASQVMSIMTNSKCSPFGYLGLGNLALGIMKYDSISEIINLLRFSGNLELIDFGGKDEFLKLMEKFETYHDIVCKYISNSEQMGQAELDLEVVEPLSSVAIDLYCLIDEFYKDSNSLVRK